MKRGLAAASVAALLGAGVSVFGVLVARWWSQRHTSSFTTFGWYAFSAPRRYTDYLPVRSGTDWTGLLVPPGVAGAVVGLLVLLVARLITRRARAYRAPSG